MISRQLSYCSEKEHFLQILKVFQILKELYFIESSRHYSLSCVIVLSLTHFGSIHGLREIGLRTVREREGWVYCKASQENLGGQS